MKIVQQSVELEFITPNATQLILYNHCPSVFADRVDPAVVMP